MKLSEIEFERVLAGREVGRISRETPLPARGTRKNVQRRIASPAQPKVSEAEIQAAILEWLCFKGIPHTVTEAKRSFNERGQLVRRIAVGWPDITTCWQAQLVGIEVKSATGKLRPAQAATLHALWLAGALVVVARSLDDVIAAFKDGHHKATEAEIAATLKKGK